MPEITSPIHSIPPAAAVDLAKFAAQGVAIALNARIAQHVGPIHILCGIPREMFNVTLEPNLHGQLGVGIPTPERQL